MQKGLTPILIVLVITILGIGGYFVYTTNYSNNRTKTAQYVQTTPAPTSDPMANWKTYTIQKYGIFFKYPSDWKFEDKTNLDLSRYKQEISFENKPVGQNAPFDDSFSFRGRVFGNILIATIKEFSGDKLLTITEQEFFDVNNSFWQKGIIKSSFGPGTVFDLPKEISIDGKRVMIQQYHPDRADQAANPAHITNSYYIILDNPSHDILNLQFSYDDRDSNKDTSISTFDKILSTFRFLP